MRRPGSGGGRTVSSIAVTPTARVVSVGSMQQFTATATYSDATQQNVTSDCTWGVDVAANASITSGTTGGLYQALQSAVVVVTATLGAVSGTVNVNNVPLVSTVSPSSGAIGSGPIAVGGNGFNNVSAVKINGTACAFTVASPTSLSITAVPNGATTGPVEVVTPGGSGFYRDFNVTNSFSVSFRNNVVPPPITAVSAGAAVWVQTDGTPTVLKVTPGAAGVYENLGGIEGGGLWTSDAYTNTITNPFDFSAGGGWTIFGGTVNTDYTANIGTWLDGVSQYSRYGKHTTPGYANTYNQGAAGSHVFALSIWMRDTLSDQPTAPGMIGADTGFGVGQSFGSGLNWRRVGVIAGSNDVLAIAPAGMQPGFVNTPLATGAIDVAGAQIELSRDLMPLTQGTAGPWKLQITSSLNLIVSAGGDLNISGTFLAANDQFGASTMGDGYVISLTIGGVLYALRYAQPFWIATIAGVDQAWQQNYNGMSPGAYEYKWRLFYQPSSNTAGVELRMNGVQDYFQVFNLARGAAPGGALAPATAGYIGSNLGAAPSVRVKHTSCFVDGSTTGPISAELLFLGDSLLAQLSQLMITTGGIYTPAESRVRAGIVSTAISGESIAQQKARYDTVGFPYNATGAQKGSLVARCFMLGMNDVINNASAATVIASIQALVNDLASDGIPVVGCVLPPARTYLDANTINGYNVLLAVNQAIQGGGATPITGLAGVASSYYNLLSDGSGNLLARYDSGQGGAGLHENNPGRQIIASAIRSDALVPLGILPAL